MERVSELTKLLRVLGFIHVHQKGSHHKWKDPKTNFCVIYSYTKNKLDKYQAKNTIKDINRILAMREG